ncbi:MAG: response regulator [Leptolyngbyaceae cyanobacterium bins.59]|nr:response regulator [Leptolyngbyaceae cyanobacterium bins.59]
MKTVFVVEDGHAEQRIVQALLTQAGFEVVIASNGDEAWQWLHANPTPNLILLDIVMPGKSGLELCRMIQETPEFNKIPIVFCSSKSEEFDRFWALRQGAKAYIVKPYAPKELLDTVYQYVQ